MPTLTIQEVVTESTASAYHMLGLQGESLVELELVLEYVLLIVRM
jgi:hypothetical protein